jgi:hypothetical protein
MSVIHNLHTNPALQIDNSPATWFGSGYARTASAHASLPRTTAWSGTGGSPVAGRFNGSAGKYYVVTASFRFTGASSGYLAVDWKTSGNAFIATGVSTSFSQGAGTTARLGGVVLAPVNTDHGDVVVSELDGATEITAVMVREFTLEADALAALAVDLVPANYADGASPGGVWDGTTGKSSSTITRAEPAGGVAELGALVGSGLAVRTAADATGVALFGPLLASTGLIPSAQYDRRRGRIRVSASGLAASAVRVIIYSRPLGTSRWAVVRGGRVAVVAGALQHPVDDYEYRAGSGMEYRVDALDTTEQQPQHVIQSVRITVTDTEERVWLKFIPAPWTNLPVELVVDDWELSRDARSDIHDVAGTSPPVIVSDVHGSIRTNVRLRTPDAASLAALQRALGQGAPAYLQVPDSIPFPTMYVGIGNFSSRRWGGRNSTRYVTTVDLVEVAAPPPSVVPASLTWGVFAQQYATWGEAAAAYDRWSDVVG